MVDELGTSCMGCKARKYGCSHTGNKDLKTMVVVRPVANSEGEEEEEEEAVEEKKGKKRAAEPPAQSKKVVKAKEVKEVKVKEEKPKVKPEPRPTEKKSKAKQQGSDEEDEDAMEVDDDESDEGEPKQKWPRLMHGEHHYKKRNNIFLKFFFRLQVQARGAGQADCCPRSTGQGL